VEVNHGDRRGELFAMVLDGGVEAGPELVAFDPARLGHWIPRLRSMASMSANSSSTGAGPVSPRGGRGLASPEDLTRFLPRPAAAGVTPRWESIMRAR